MEKNSQGFPGGKMSPELRFKGFEGEWNNSLLSDWIIPSKEKNSDNLFSLEDVLSVSGDFGVVNQIEFQGRSFAGASVANYGVVRTGDIVYTKSPLKRSPYGIIKTNKDVSGIVSTLYAIYKCNDCTCPNFIQEYFNLDNRLNSYLRPLVRKGAKNDMKISAADALKGNVIFPDLLEQISISDFLGILDRQFSLYQKKLEGLKRLKYSMLVKMFPKEGAAIPEIRFKEFEGEWNNLLSKDIFKTIADKNHPELPVLSASQELGMIKRDDVGKVVIHDKSNETTYKRVMPGQFVIHLRSFQGGFAHSAYEGITSPAYTIIDFKDVNYHCDIFWKYIFMSKQFIKSLESVTYGIRDGRSISYEDFSTSYLIFPLKDEQSKIGQYFQSLDRLISLHEQKLNKLKNLKTSLLQKMFV